MPATLGPGQNPPKTQPAPTITEPINSDRSMGFATDAKNHLDSTSGCVMRGMTRWCNTKMGNMAKPMKIHSDGHHERGPIRNASTSV